MMILYRIGIDWSLIQGSSRCVPTRDRLGMLIHSLPTSNLDRLEVDPWSARCRIRATVGCPMIGNMAYRDVLVGNSGSAISRVGIDWGLIQDRHGCHTRIDLNLLQNLQNCRIEIDLMSNQDLLCVESVSTGGWLMICPYLCTQSMSCKIVKQPPVQQWQSRRGNRQRTNAQRRRCNVD